MAVHPLSRRYARSGMSPTSRRCPVTAWFSCRSRACSPTMCDKDARLPVRASFLSSRSSTNGSADNADRSPLRWLSLRTSLRRPTRDPSESMRPTRPSRTRCSSTTRPWCTLSAVSQRTPFQPSDVAQPEQASKPSDHRPSSRDSDVSDLLESPSSWRKDTMTSWSGDPPENAGGGEHSADNAGGKMPNPIWSEARGKKSSLSAG